MRKAEPVWWTASNGLGCIQSIKFANISKDTIYKQPGFSKIEINHDAILKSPNKNKINQFNNVINRNKK